jgi:plasmid stabilization system protein ParE
MRKVLLGLRALVPHPRIGRPAAEGLRELVLSVGKTGDVVLYRYVEVADAVLVLRLRQQREAGYPSL